ncbi:MAG: hypothetical protein ACK53C_04305 [Pseudomonadota bacterium]
MNAFEIRALIGELIDENPFAIRALLKIVAVEFTDAVPTLAVTCEARPRLLINLAFVRRHCRTAEHVKAVLCHEFLHVLLRHTSLPGRLTPARHLALDAVINAIIHRQLGPAYSELMSRYYAAETGLGRLLRPMTDAEARWPHDRAVQARRGAAPRWWSTWQGLYRGTVIADDLEQLAAELAPEAGVLAGDGAVSASVRGAREGATPSDGALPGAGRLLGNHTDDFESSDALDEALARAGRELNGGGIWRSAGRGPGAAAYSTLVDARHVALAEWKRRTLEVLKRHLAPAPGSPRSAVPVTARLPVLSPSDRRAFLRATWSPFLPEATWSGIAERPEGRAQVYLDVSGSMNAEMPLIVGLLGSLSRWIRRPFWAFSTVVAPAVIERGQLKADTSGGTSLACVLEHGARTRPSAAVIVTDGYVESITRLQLAATRGTRLHAVVTRDGNPAPLRAAGIPYSQLGRLPT